MRTTFLRLPALLGISALLVLSATPTSAAIACSPEPGVWITICEHHRTQDVIVVTPNNEPEFQRICPVGDLCFDVVRPLTLVTSGTTTVAYTIYTAAVNAPQIISDVCGLIGEEICSVTIAARDDPSGALVPGALVTLDGKTYFLDLVPVATVAA